MGVYDLPLLWLAVMIPPLATVTFEDILIHYFSVPPITANLPCLWLNKRKHPQEIVDG
jgi:hypothetical protein